MTTTYTLTLTPPDGPKTQRHGLTRDEAMWALTDLMYGDPFNEAAEPGELPRRDEERLAA